jgi:hypothetical protein
MKMSKEEDTQILIAFMRTQPPGKIELKDPDLIEQMKNYGKTAGRAAFYRTLQSEQMLRLAKRAGFL